MSERNIATKQPYDDEIDDFIGRNEELKQLSDNLAQINSKKRQAHLVFIKGKGGVGKTVFIRKFKQKNILRLSKADNQGLDYVPVDYDFDNNAFHSAENLRLSIALVLTNVFNLSFKNYLIQHKDVKDARKSGSRPSSEYIKKLHKKATEKWIEIIEKSEKKFIFYFDTIDKLSSVQIKQIGKYFFSHIPKNSFVIISGRDEKIKLIQKVIKQENYKLYNEAISINLKPLVEEEYIDFIGKKIRKYGYSTIKDLPIEKPVEFIAFIKEVSDGLPILIGLSLEPFASSRTTEKINAYLQDINHLKSMNLNKDKLHAKFKALLIHHYLENYSSQLRLLVLILAHAWPLGRRAIKDVRGLNDDSTDILMEEARQAIYIKRISNNLYNTKANIAKSPYFLSLHDVMREMINEYVWQGNNENSEIREEVSEKYIKILSAVIKDGKDKQKEISENKNQLELIESGDQLLLYNLQALLQRLDVQKARHKACLKIEDGLNFFSSTLKKGSTEYKNTQSQYIYELSYQIEDILKTFHGKNIYQLFSEASSNNKIQQESLVDYFIEKLNFLTSRGDLKEANKIILELEKIKNKLSFEFQIELFREIATTFLKNGNLNEGFKLLRELETNCKYKNDKVAFIQLFPVYVQMGWAYRLLGNITKADECYADADALLLEENLLPGADIDMIEVALLYQTWAYTKALLGKSREAKQFLSVAQSKFNELNFDLGEGYIQSVSGRIQIEFDDYEDAIRCFEKSQDVFPEDNEEWQSKVLLGMAEAHILLSEYKKDILSKEDIKQHINVACDYLKSVETWNYPSERPETLFTLATLNLQKKEYQLANTYFKKAWNESKAQGSLYYLYRSLIGQIRLTIFEKLEKTECRCKTAEDFISRHTDMVKHHDGITEDKLAHAIFWKTIGDLHFLEGNHTETLNYYKKYLPIIADKGRFYAISLKGQLDRTQELFIKYSSDNAGEPIETKVEEIHILAQELWGYWKTMRYTRKYPSANPIIRSWISGKIDEWNHPPIDIKNKLGEE